MAEPTFDNAAWQEGYRAALRDVEQRAGQLQEWAGAASLESLLAELRAGLSAHGHRAAATTSETHGIPREDLEREWTGG